MILEVMCQVCKSGTHPLVLLRRRLDDNAFERLLEARDGARAAKAAGMELGAAAMGNAIDVT